MIKPPMYKNNVMNEKSITKMGITEAQHKSPERTFWREHFAGTRMPGIHDVFFLQKNLGNQKIETLLRQHNIQAKLSISQPDDVDEKEADRVADQVMRMAEPPMQHQPFAQEKKHIQLKSFKITPLVQRQKDEEEEKVQTKRLTLQRAAEEEQGTPATGSQSAPLTNRPARPSDPDTQMSKLLATAKSNAAGQRGLCYAALKKNIKLAGGYGDILEIDSDERFTGLGLYALQFSKAVKANGAANLGLEETTSTVNTAESGSILILQGHPDLNISETYGDISVIGGKEGWSRICYNDGKMVLPGPAAVWEKGGLYYDRVVGIYKAILRLVATETIVPPNTTPKTTEPTQTEKQEVKVQPKRETVRDVPQIQRQGEEEDKEEETTIQKEKNNDHSPVSPNFEQALRTMKGGGRPLDPATREYFEPRFGVNFCDVRVHTGGIASDTARTVNAQAFTIGRDIVFNSGRYAPESEAGKKLLAHELTHVVQQHDGFLLQRSPGDEQRSKIVTTALGLKEEHYLMGAAGQIPDLGGGINNRSVVLDATTHGASIEVNYGGTEGKKKFLCGGRANQVKSLPEGDPKNAGHQKSPEKYKWDRGDVFGEACEGKRHFDCGGFVSYCYHQACSEVSYPGPAQGLLSKQFGFKSRAKREDVVAGDIAYRPGHAGLCISNDKVISTLGRIWGVTEESTNKYTTFGYLSCLDKETKIKEENSTEKNTEIKKKSDETSSNLDESISTSGILNKHKRACGSESGTTILASMHQFPGVGVHRVTDAGVAIHPKRVFIIGSPSPAEISASHPYQFVNAALCQGVDEDTVWIVEKTGYEAGKVDLGFITSSIGKGKLIWLEPEDGLVSVLNEFPSNSINQCTVFSHGLANLVTLRYGWEQTGKKNYGLSISDVRRMRNDLFTTDAVISFDSCNSGTSDFANPRGNVAQQFAQQSGRDVQGWTGRTSYAQVNKPGTCEVGGSETFRGIHPDFKEAASRYLLGRDPQRRTFSPLRGSRVGGFQSFFEIKVRLPSTRSFDVPDNGSVLVTCPNPELLVPDDMLEFFKRGQEETPNGTAFETEESYARRVGDMAGQFWVALYTAGGIRNESIGMHTFPVATNDEQAIWSNLRKGSYYIEIYRLNGNQNIPIRSEINVEIYG
jgi:hypothetical protein